MYVFVHLYRVPGTNLPEHTNIHDRPDRLDKQSIVLIYSKQNFLETDLSLPPSLACIPAVKQKSKKIGDQCARESTQCYPAPRTGGMCVCDSICTLSMTDGEWLVDPRVRDVCECLHTVGDGCGAVGCETLRWVCLTNT